MNQATKKKRRERERMKRWHATSMWNANFSCKSDPFDNLEPLKCEELLQ